MTYVCKNRCCFDGFKEYGVVVVTRQSYKNGTKYCVECCYFCKTKLLACPCCGRRFRTTRKKKVQRRISIGTRN